MGKRIFHWIRGHLPTTIYIVSSLATTAISLVTLIGSFVTKKCWNYTSHKKVPKMLHPTDTSKNPVGCHQQRKTPPIGSYDTIIFCDGKIQGCHGNTSFFTNEEIVEKLFIRQRVKLDTNIYADYTKYGKAIIQQQSTRGCTG